MHAQQTSSPSIIAAYALAIASALEQHGVDAHEVFEKAQVRVNVTTDPMQRLNNLQVSRLFRESVRVTDNPYFGITVAECMHPGNFHALGYALLSSASLREFCDRLCNYYRLVSQNADIRLLEGKDTAIIATAVNNPDICYETADTFACYIVRLMRFVSQPTLNPRHIDLIRPKPERGERAFIDYFKCDVEFDQPEIQIHIDASLLDKPLQGGSQELAQMHDQTVRQYLQKLEKEDIVNRVRALIVDRLSSGVVTKQQAAEGVHMSPRNLQAKLATQNTSFQEILETTRQSLAMGYIEQSSISITEISYLLGFSDLSNFTRAFKRWTNKSPTEFRQSLHID
jgi:AraC-like DNA-binding protein